MSQSTRPAPPAFLDSNAKQLLIGGELAGRARLARPSTRSIPQTAEVLAADREGRGGGHRSQAAGGGAGRAWRGPWSRFGPAQRQAVLLKLADLIAERSEEVALIDTFDMGAPLVRNRMSSSGASNSLRWFASAARSIRGATIENSLPHMWFRPARSGSSRSEWWPERSVLLERLNHEPGLEASAPRSRRAARIGACRQSKRR